MLHVVYNALPLFGAMICYVAFNVAVVESGGGTVNFAVMNLGAGVLTAFIFRRELTAGPWWRAAALGAGGIVAIVYGLRWTHAALADPANTMEVIYDLVVFSSVALWWAVERPLGLRETKVYRFDIILHLVMAGLVFTRLQLHWQDGWQPITFLPALVAVAGYWMLNVSIRLANEQAESPRTTNVAMNIMGGVVLIGLAWYEGGVAVIPRAGAIAIGVLALVGIVYCLGRSYQALGPIGLAPFVMVGVYDGLLIIAPLAMGWFYNLPYGLADAVITGGFVLVMTTRILFYRRLARSR